MAESFSAADLEFGADDLEFADAPNDQPQATPGDWKSLWLTLGERLFAGAAPGMAQVAGQARDAIMAPVEVPRGVLTGLKREEVAPDASMQEKAAGVAGRYGLPVAAALAAGAAAPAVIPASAGTLAALGAGAAMTGAGAAAGDLAGMGASKALGGEAPETLGEAVTSAGKTGLETAAVELGLGGAAAALKAVAPTAFQVFSKINAESLKRAIKNPDAVVIGPGAETKVTIQAAKALRDTQRVIERVRVEKGEAVGKALDGFQAAVKGRPVVNASVAADAAEAAILDATQASSAIEAAIPGAELRRVNKIVSEIRKSPQMSPLEANRLRKAIDDLTKFRKGGVPPVSSAAGQRAVKELGAGLRQAIDEAATAANYSALRQANADFSKYAGLYDEVSAAIGTKEITPAALIKKVKQIGSTFNAGPTEARALEKLAENIPEASAGMNRLLDLIAARELTKLPRSTPSSVFKDAVLFLTAPQAVGAGVKAAPALAPVGRVARRAIPSADGSRRSTP